MSITFLQEGYKSAIIKKICDRKHRGVRDHRIKRVMRWTCDDIFVKSGRTYRVLLMAKL